MMIFTLFVFFFLYKRGREIRHLSCLAAIGVDPFTASKTHFFLWTRYIQFRLHAAAALVFPHVYLFCTIQYTLYPYRRNAVLFQELFIENVAALDVSNYVRENPTKIYVHGFMENGETDLSLKLRKRILHIYSLKNCHDVTGNGLCI